MRARRADVAQCRHLLRQRRDNRPRRAAERVIAAYTVGEGAPEVPDAILGRIGPRDVTGDA